MLKNIKTYLLLLIILFSLTACPEDKFDYEEFTFYNYSEHNVAIYLGVAPRERGGSLFPDTGIMEIRTVSNTIKSGKHIGYGYNKNKQNDTLCLFVFDIDTINKYSWEDVKNNYLILKRYDLTFSDKGLDIINYNVTYPPSHLMKDVIMYPPYSE